MKKFSKIFFYLTAVVLLSWLLPWLLQFAASKPGNDPFTLYSCVTKRFAYIQSSKDNGVKRYDANGTEYTVAQFDSILPTFYYRQLFSKDRLPDTINGKEVTPKIIAHGNFTFKQSARDVNVTKPALNMIMESMPDRIDLENPIEAFRTTDRITFIDMRDNTVNEKKSALFDKVMKQKGFEFPVRTLSGNPTNRKEYDEGYLMVDNNHRIFHVKQTKGLPYVRETGVAPELGIEHVAITEFSNRKTLGLLTDKDNNLYVLNRDYTLHKLPIDKYDPKTNTLTIMGDIFYWTLKISDEKGVTTYAVDADSYAFADSLRYDYPETALDKWSKYIFPFELSFTSYDDQWVKPRVSMGSCWVLILNFVLAALLYFTACKGSTCSRRQKFITTVATMILGIYLFIPLLVCKRA